MYPPAGADHADEHRTKYCPPPLPWFFQTLADEAAVDQFVRRHEVAIVGIMEKEGSEAHLMFKEAAEADFGRAYGVTFDDKVRKGGREGGWRGPSDGFVVVRIRLASRSPREGRQLVRYVCVCLGGKRGKV